MSNIIQGSEAWFDLKRGKVSASHIVDIMPGVKGKYMASRKNYISQLVCEILTGTTEETFTSGAMAWGIETEPLARTAYEILTGEWVNEVPFIDHIEIDRCGCSPDGLVGKKGGLEIKCPNTATHIDTLLHETVKRDYIFQMQHCMSCTDRKWWDFVSFDPRMDEKNQIFLKRFDRDNAMIAEIDSEIIKVNQEVDTLIEKLRNR